MIHQALSRCLFPFVKLVALALVLFFSGTLAQAAPITFDFVFQQPGGPATATGSITFEENLLPNPGSFGPSPNLPNPAVLALQVTVSGAASGNGTFTLSDFDGISWDTNGGTLNLHQQLVGQPTTIDPWGTQSDGGGGDFNLFGSNGTAPVGEYYFALCADDGTSTCMDLTSMVARSTTSAIPTLNEGGIAVLLFMITASGLLLLRRNRHVRSASK